MSLFNIQDKLYKKDNKKNETIVFHDKDQYDPKNAANQVPSAENIDLWEEKQKGLGKFEKKVIWKSFWIFAVAISVIILSFAIYQGRKLAFTEGSAYVSITGPDQAKSGRLLTYEINYKNDNWASAGNSTIKIAYPDNFKPEESPNFKIETPTSGIYTLGSVKGRSQGKVVLNGRAYSPKGALIYLKADFSYQPFNYSSRFSAKAQHGINIISSPIKLEIQAPQNVPSGDAINYLVSFRNDGSDEISNLKIKMDYPEEFVFSRGDPTPSEANNIWFIGSLTAGQSGKIVVSGKLSGQRDQIKLVRVSIGTSLKDEFVSLNDESADTRIVSSPLTIAQSVNGFENISVNSGETLQYKIMFKNKGDIGLRDVIVTEKLDSPVLDYTTLDISGGSFDYDTKTITWKASDYPGLKNLGANQGGTISFNIKVKDMIDVGSANDKNFIISSLAKIDSPDIPTPISMNKIIASNLINLKLNSKLILDVKGYYNDTVISNSGPIPPKVNQETTYTIHWKIINVSNDLADAKVTASLLTTAKMTGKIYPEDVRINHNERDNSVTWDIGKIIAGTGVLNAPLEGAFQVQIKPSPEQVGKEVGILGVAKITAKDLWTGEMLEKSGAAKNTNFFEDKGLSSASRVEE